MIEQIKVKRSIRWKILSLMIALIVSMLAMFTFVLIRSQKAFIENELNVRIDLIKENLVEKGKTLSDNLAFQVEDAIASFNLMSIIKQTEKAVQKQKDLDYIILTDYKGVAHIHTKRSQLQGALLDSEEDRYAIQQTEATINEFKKYGNPFMEFIVPLEISDELWGVLRLGYSLEELNKVIYNSKVKIRRQIEGIIIRSVFTAIVILIIGSGVVLVILNRISKPLINLTKSANKLAMGNFDTDDNIAVQSNDEVGVLAQTFREMSKELKKFYEKQEEYSHNLEKKVKDRTIELAAAHDQAVAANESKSRYLANMSHEIRTPLNSIVGFSQILLKEGLESSMPNEFLQFLKNIKLSGENLSELINNVLDLSKIEAGKTFLSMDNLNLKLLVQGIFHTNKAQALQNKVEFSYAFAHDLPEIIYSDRTKLNQILMNLISNAIKFTPEGKKVKLEAQLADKCIVFKIEDEGVGIPVEQQDAIFEPFIQVEAETDRAYTGTGLGLSITKSMVKLLDGEIGLQSEIGKGSIFTVQIPFSKSSEELVVQQNFKWENIKFQKDCKILIAEDDTMNQEMIQALFKTLGLAVEIIDNGKSVMEIVNELKPDFILMDMDLKGINGLECAQEIRKHPEYNDVPVVAFSANAFREQQQVACEVGITDYLTKPVNVNKLVTLLMKYLPYELKLENQITADCAELSGELNAKLLHEFTILSEIPYYLTGKMTSLIQKILKLCNGYNIPLVKIIEELEEAVYSLDDKKTASLIKKVLDMLGEKR